MGIVKELEDTVRNYEASIKQLKEKYAIPDQVYLTDSTGEIEVSMSRSQEDLWRQNKLFLPKDRNGKLFSYQKYYTCEIDGRVFEECSLVWRSNFGFCVCHADDIFSPELVAIITAPYDKHGKVIECGDWVSSHKQKGVHQVTDVRPSRFSWRSLLMEVWCGREVSYWCFEEFDKWEVVSEPDSIEKIKADALLEPIPYCQKRNIESYSAIKHRLDIVDRVVSLYGDWSESGDDDD